MLEARTQLLPLHQLLAELNEWRATPSAEQHAKLRAAFERIVDAHAVSGAFVAVFAPPLPEIELGFGTLREGPTASLMPRTLQVGAASETRADLWVDGPSNNADALESVLELAIDADMSRHDARFQRQQLEGLDAAVRGIAGVLAVDRVLQLIVDRVRDLVGAQYAALGVVGRFGNIEQFITSGLSDEVRRAIGPPPRGHGLLGLIIREEASILIEDIGMDPRRYGFPPNHPEMHSFLGVPVRSKGRTIGNLYLTNKLTSPTFNGADLSLVERFALHAGIAMENARLHEEIQRLAVVDERERISQDLHDSIIQSLYAISLSLEDLPDIIAEDPDEGAARADRAIDSIHGTIRDIRNFIFGLRPELLEDSDLPTGLETLAAEFRANTLIDLELHLAADLPEIPGEHAAHILAITREALSNIARHSGATRASVELFARNGTVRLVIGDNGHGFETDEPRSQSQHGLGNLRARAEGAGGSFTLTSQVGGGTRVEAQIPLREN